MNWKEQQKEQVQSIRTGMPSVSVLRIAIKAMLDHWPDEPEQCDDAKSMAFMANTIQAAHEALGTAVGDDLVMACERFRKERDRLQDALAEQMDENGRLAGRVKAFEREKEARRRHDRMCQLGPGGW